MIALSFNLFNIQSNRSDGQVVDIPIFWRMRRISIPESGKLTQVAAMSSSNSLHPNGITTSVMKMDF